MEEGRLFKGSFFGFSKKDVLRFFEELNDEQKRVLDLKEKDISKLKKAVTELARNTEKLQEENKKMTEEIDSMKSAVTEPNAAYSVITEKAENIVIRKDIEDEIYEEKSLDSALVSSEFAEKKEFDPRNSDLYCELLKEIETLRQEKEETKRQFEEAISEIRDGYEKKLMEKNDEIYNRRQKYFNAVLEHIQYKRNAEKKLHELTKDN